MTHQMCDIDPLLDRNLDFQFGNLKMNKSLLLHPLKDNIIFNYFALIRIF